VSFNNRQMHGVALVGTLVIGGAALGATVYLTSPAEASQAEPPREMVTIEAQLARKASKPHQPVKPRNDPPPEVKPEGVSRDETHTPDPKKPDPKKPKPADKPPDIKQFHHPTDDDPQPGSTPTTDIGQFDGSEKGFAPINAGNPFWQHLNADFHQAWEIPQISQVAGASIACLHLERDGKIVSFKLDPPSGDQILDDSVQRAMKIVQKARNDNPQPVPTEQLGVIKRLVCFRFDPKS
jgi:TonB C terminal